MTFPSEVNIYKYTHTHINTSLFPCFVFVFDKRLPSYDGLEVTFFYMCYFEQREN